MNVQVALGTFMILSGFIVWYWHPDRRDAHYAGLALIIVGSAAMLP